MRKTLTGATQTDNHKILAHYESVDEASRLFTSWCQLEMARTQEIILRYLPSSPALVLDVGGGPGVYSAWLARLGHEVHLIDVIPKHIEQAKQISQQQPDHPTCGIRGRIDPPRRTGHSTGLMLRCSVPQMNPIGDLGYRG